MQDFLLNIDNKEILIEILHHSIDYLIGNRNDQNSVRLFNKFGFQSSDDFMLTTKAIARCYRNCCMERSSEADLLSDFANLSPDLQKFVSSVLESRRPEVMQFLRRYLISEEAPLVESYDWDLRYILGDSSFAENHRQITTITFNCRSLDEKRNDLHFEIDQSKLDDFIKELEKSITDQELSSVHI